LILKTMSSLLSSFFLSKPIGFPSKIMSFKLNHNFICLRLGPLSKSLGTNLKFFTNRNVWFHWTLLLQPLSKVALKLRKSMHSLSHHFQPSKFKGFKKLFIQHS
jgi:hypothetical protein